jgi:endonuclease G
MNAYKSPLESLRQDQEVMEDLRNLFGGQRKVAEFENAQEVRSLNRKAIVEFLAEPVGPLETHDRDEAFLSEAIVLAVGRPSLLIQDGKIDVSELQVPSLKKRLEAHRKMIELPIPSIGRVELISHPDYEWVGTGWLAEGGVLITNRHVANIFAEQRNGVYSFRRIMGNTVRAWIDFREEHRRAEEIEIEVERIIYIAPPGAQHPDIAMLKLREHADLPEQLELALADAKERDHVGVVGYPAWDGRRNPGLAMSRIFQDVYNVKRFLRYHLSRDHVAGGLLEGRRDGQQRQSARDRLPAEPEAVHGRPGVRNRRISHLPDAYPDNRKVDRFAVRRAH